MTKAVKKISDNNYKAYMELMVSLYQDNRLIANTLSIYTSWILIHYVSSHLYSLQCTNYSIWGFITSPINISTPYCRGLSWVIYSGSEKIFNMWNLLGSYALSYIST